SFVGDNLLAPMANSFRDVDLDAIMRGSNLFWLVPGILVAIATLVAGIRIIRGRWPGASPNIKTGAFVVLALYWFPMVIVGFGTHSSKERYVLNSHLLGYLFVAMIMIRMVDRWQDARETPGSMSMLAQVFSVAVV